MMRGVRNPISSDLLIGVVLALAFVLPPGNAFSQAEFSGLPLPGTPVFDFDWAAFRSSGDSVRLEIYYKIANPRLSYIRRALKPGDSLPRGMAASTDSGGAGEYYMASYELSGVLATDDDAQAATVGHRENYVLPSFRETRDPSGFLVNIVTAYLRPKVYELSLTLHDRVAGTSHAVGKAIDLSANSGENWVLGGPLFFDAMAAAPDHPVFLRQGQGLVPRAGRTAAGLGDRLALYVEVYRGSLQGAARMLVDVEQRHGRRHRTDTIAICDSMSTVPVIYRSALPGFGMGEAMLRLILIDGDGKRTGDPLETPFWIDWSLNTLIEADWDEAVDMLIHIATHEDLKTLRATPLEGRAAAFAAFWKSKDPSPGSEENEWQEEYYRRIRHADLHFTSAFARGWRTDFGTVYARYGEPDEIDRHPFERGAKSYQVWFYYAQRRQFTFVDLRGDGAYDLQYPYDGIIR